MVVVVELVIGFVVVVRPVVVEVRCRLVDVELGLQVEVVMCFQAAVVEEMVVIVTVFRAVEVAVVMVVVEVVLVLLQLRPRPIVCWFVVLELICQFEDVAEGDGGI
jgi:hypothetical protein